MEESLSKIKLSRLEKIINSVKNSSNNEDPDISFEFIIAALYPDVYKNIKDALNQEHTLGYIEGLEAAKHENSSEQ